MALAKCKECSREVSKSAKVCPGCGINNPAPGRISGYWAVALIIGAFFIIPQMFSGQNSSTATAPSPSAPTASPTSSAPAPVNKQQKQGNEFKARAIAGVNIMKEVVPDPEKLKINKAFITTKGDVCYEFIFTNASGGISRQKSVLPVSGDSLLLPLSDGFTKAWNTMCAGKKGDDIVDYLEIATKR